MSNLVQIDTGLDHIVWVSAKTGREKHGPRIKVQKTNTRRIRPNDWVSVTISDSPVMIDKDKTVKISNKEFKRIKEFIRANRTTLDGYWNSTISTKAMVTAITPIN